MARYEDIFAQLAAEFEPAEVKTRRGPDGKPLSYVTARTVMNRFDAVLGPWNWSDNSTYEGGVATCKITITLPKTEQYPDGLTVTHSGVSGTPKMPDPSDGPKGAKSEAFKTAAVLFGPGRYLYQDGVVDYDADGGPRVETPGKSNSTAPAAPTRSQAPPAANRQAPQGERKFDPFRVPRTARSYFPWLKDMEAHYQTELRKKSNAIAADMGLPWNTKEWSDDQANNVALRLIAEIMLLPNYQGEYDSVVGENHGKPAGAQTDDLGVLRRKLRTAIVNLFKEQNGGATPNREQLVAVLGKVSSLAQNAKGLTGEVVETTEYITDPVWAKNMVSLVESKAVSLQEGAAFQEDIPF